MIESDARVSAQFEALLLEPLLKPFSAAFGEFDTIAAQAFARVLAGAWERTP